jgi:uncharacterized protein (TIGR03437 family)
MARPQKGHTQGKKFMRQIVSPLPLRLLSLFLIATPGYCVITGLTAAPSTVALSAVYTSTTLRTDSSALIVAAGTGTVAITAATSGDTSVESCGTQRWLTAALESGTVTGGGAVGVTISANPTCLLSSPFYIGYVTVSGGGYSAVITVVFVIYQGYDATAALSARMPLSLPAGTSQTIRAILTLIRDDGSVYPNPSEDPAQIFTANPSPTSGTGWLTAATNGTVNGFSITVNAVGLSPGLYSGVVTVSGDPEDSPYEVVINVTAVVTPAAGNTVGPSISSVATANSGTAITQNTFISIKGSNLVPATTAASGVDWSTAPAAAGQLPTQINGVSVTVNNKPAFVAFYCSAATDSSCPQDQINVLTPLDNTIGQVPVVVTSGTVASPPFSVNMQSVAPSFLSLSGPYVSAKHADNTLVGPGSLYPGQSTPAGPGETIMVYGVGFGLPTTPLVNGSSTQSGSLPGLPVCTLGGSPAKVTAAGLVSPGIYQLSLTIPPDAVSGDNPVSCTYGGATTPIGNLITVQQPD